MEHGFYAEAKNYILYRWQRTERRKALNHIVNETGDETITDTLKGIGQDFPRNEYSLTLLAEKFSSFYKPEMTPNERLTALIKAAVELTTQEAPDWEFIAARLLNFQLSKKLTEQAEFAGVLSFYEKLRYLTDEGLYGSYILASYSPEEMVGKRVVAIVNLKPCKLAGVVSEGMLLCAEDENGELSLMVPEKKMPSGAEIC